jgi:hypothetical protein
MLIGASPTLQPCAQLMSAPPEMEQSGHADINEIDHFRFDARRRRRPLQAVVGSGAF